MLNRAKYFSTKKNSVYTFDILSCKQKLFDVLHNIAKTKKNKMVNQLKLFSRRKIDLSKYEILSEYKFRTL